jgi:hypothetical protein
MMQHCGPMQRRSLLKLSVASGVALAAIGGGFALIRPGLEDGRLTPAGRQVFWAVGRAVLEGSLPETAADQAAALSLHMLRMNDTITGLPTPIRAELSQLLAVLASAPGRLALAGLSAEWETATPEQIQAALQGMRTSTLDLRQQAYHALRDLTNAAYYADPSTWPLLRYPGQRAVQA